MYVCLCRGVSDRKVRQAVARGASTIEEIGERCGAGTRCGGCWPALDDLLEASGRSARAAGGAHRPMVGAAVPRTA